MDAEELTEMESEVVRVRYGIESFNEENILKFAELRRGKNLPPGKSIAQVAEILNVPETVVLALEKSALFKLLV